MQKNSEKSFQSEVTKRDCPTEYIKWQILSNNYKENLFTITSYKKVIFKNYIYFILLSKTEDSLKFKLMIFYVLNDFKSKIVKF